MINVYKASAGSGKTFALTGTYLRMVLRTPDPSSFRHILAVTFTNKATAEMKGRILKELHTLSVDPASSKYADSLVPETVESMEELRKRSKAVLVAILHDYSAFAVSTIDKFFQQTLRSFARELGQFAPYQIEIDTGPIVGEAVDRVLDNVTENDTEMLSWLGENVTDSLSKGEKPSIEKPLYEMASKLRRFNIDRGEFSRNDLSTIREDCLKVISGFARALSDAAPDHYPVPDISSRIKYPSSAKALDALPSAARDLFIDRYPMYLTAWTILGEVWDLGITEDFLTAFDEILSERNIMCLDDSNSLLRDIIDDCEAPFVYEKTGVRYEHFLLDEFQDTSTVQWADFVPLLKESESSGRDSLVVGDIKQSIYRWRGSDWKLLSRGITAEFDNVVQTTLDSNWRSARRIVLFNNDFFPYAASLLGLSEIYTDVRQEAKSPDAGGMVQVDFVEGKPEGEIDAVLSSVERLRCDAGASWHDITVLVRGNKEGGRIASHLIAHGIPVITDDSLDIRNSTLVRRLVALLECVENPQDSIATYASSSLGIGLPQTWHSLLDLAENLMGCLVERFPEAASAEVLYLQSFMDCLRDWTSAYGNSLLGFLRYWKETSLCISSPPDSDSVRIMTVHKSKGLEFKYVIFPFAENVSLFKPSLAWCRPSVRVSSASDRHYPVELSGTLERSYFAEDLARERNLQKVDALNIFYVALTRAVKYLHVISCMPSKDCIAAAGKQKDGFDFKNLSQVLYYYCTKHGFSFGTLQQHDADGGAEDCKNCPPAAGQAESLGTEPFALECRYESYPMAGGLRVRRQDMSSDEGPRREGTVLHDILSRVNLPSDLPSSLSEALGSGEVSLAECESYGKLLKSALDAHPEWFPEETSGTRIHNEVSIFSADGSVLRPDRVILGPDGSVVVVDFKFGTLKRSEYLSQVRQYVELYRSLGYKEVSGFVWYIRLGQTVMA